MFLIAVYFIGRYFSIYSKNANERQTNRYDDSDDDAGGDSRAFNGDKQ